MKSKTLREDRTAADKKHVAYCDPPQAENLASEILFKACHRFSACPEFLVINTYELQKLLQAQQFR